MIIIIIIFDVQPVWYLFTITYNYIYGIYFQQICPAYLYLVYGMTELMVPVFDFSEDTPEKSTGSPKDKYQFKVITETMGSMHMSRRPIPGLRRLVGL